MDPHPRLPLTSVVDTLIHALQCLPATDAAVVVVESSLRRGDTVRPFLLERLEWNRNGKARAALELVTGCGESLRLWHGFCFRREGFRCEAQVPVNGVGRVDFLLEGFLVVEVDGGDKYHADHNARNRDKHRNNELIARGYLYPPGVVHHGRLPGPNLHGTDGTIGIRG